MIIKRYFMKVVWYGWLWIHKSSDKSGAII